MYFEKGGRQDTPTYRLSDLTPGQVIEGPAILIDDISCIVVRTSAGITRCDAMRATRLALRAWSAVTGEVP